MRRVAPAPGQSRKRTKIAGVTALRERWGGVGGAGPGSVPVGEAGEEAGDDAVAAGGLERVQLGEGVTGVLLEGGAEHGLGPGESLLHVVGGEPEEVGDLGGGQLLDLTENEDGAVGLGEVVDQLLQQVVQLGTGEALLWGSGHGGLLLEHLGGDARPLAIPAKPLEGLVEADAQKPGGEAGAPGELSEAREVEDVCMFR